MRRFLYLLGFTTFGLLVPIAVINFYFPFANFLEQSAGFKIATGGLITFLMVFLFAGKYIAKWVKEFDRVTPLKSIFMWITFVFPMAFATGIVYFTAYFSMTVIPIMTYILISHMVAGIFSILAEAERVERFKRWVKN